MVSTSWSWRGIASLIFVHAAFSHFQPCFLWGTWEQCCPHFWTAQMASQTLFGSTRGLETAYSIQSSGKKTCLHNIIAKKFRKLEYGRRNRLSPDSSYFTRAQVGKTVRYLHLHLSHPRRQWNQACPQTLYLPQLSILCPPVAQKKQNMTRFLLNFSDPFRWEIQNSKCLSNLMSLEWKLRYWEFLLWALRVNTIITTIQKWNVLRVFYSPVLLRGWSQQSPVMTKTVPWQRNIPIRISVSVFRTL